MNIKPLTSYLFENCTSIKYSFINEAVFQSIDFNKHNYKYIKSVIEDLLNNREVKLGTSGQDGSINIIDFDEEKLRELLEKLNNNGSITKDDFNATYKEKTKNNKDINIWSKIYKAPYSGTVRKINGGLNFENQLCLALQNIISPDVYNVNIENNDNSEIYNLAKKFIQYYNDNVKTNNIIEQLIEKLKDKSDNINIDITKYIFVSGKKDTQLNKDSKIINTKTLKINKNADINDSGKIIADITITTSVNEYAINNDNSIFISCKDGAAQLSAISLQNPFYGSIFKTNISNTDIYKNETFESFEKSNGYTNLKALTDLLCISTDAIKSIYEYFRVCVDNKLNNRPNNEKHKDISDFIVENNSDDLVELLKNIMGTNYYYVNSNGTIKYIDNKYYNNITFTPEEAYLTPKQIVLSGKLNNIDFSFKFRDSGDFGLPYRLFLVPKDKTKFLNLLFEK